MDTTDHDRPRLRLGADPEEEALEWLARRTSGEMSDGEAAAFAAWLGEPENARCFAEIEQVWSLMGEALDPPDNVVALGRPHGRSGWRRAVGVGAGQTWRRDWGRRVAALAASVAVLGLTGYQYATVWRYDHATEGAARGHAELADGSSIELNTGSAIDVSFEGGQRRVNLARGEAFFDVKRDPARPFVITAGAGEVRVLGTAFAVKRESEGARVTVIRGKVRVSSGDAFVDLVPGQQIAFGGGGAGLAGGARQVDAAAVTAWSRGQLVFKNRPLAEVVAEIDRYYPGVIVLTNSAAGRRRIDATVDLTRIGEWMSALERSQNVSARQLPGLIVVS